jgi:hypothetical protein
MTDEASLLQVAQDLGLTFTTSSKDVVGYMALVAEELAAITHEPGYSEALVAEGHNVALYALGRDIDAADAADRALVNTLTTVLAIGVRMLV